jgi:hypothetical protein
VVFGRFEAGEVESGTSGFRQHLPRRFHGEAGFANTPRSGEQPGVMHGA